ncbi:MAG: alkaline phosphatase family protein [Myxococcota bacterium]
MPTRSLIVGLDGADVDVIHALGPERLPQLHRLMREGAWARLESVQPPATLPNWTTFLTGVDPGRHGVFDFTTRDADYRVRFTAGTVREAPTLAARLDALGLRCAVVAFPGTYPPERLTHGAFVSGWDAPVAFAADRSFVWPPSLHDAMKARFGALRFDDVDEFDAAAPGWHAALAGALERRIARKLELALALMDGALTGTRAWDLFAVYFGESDTASHHLWAHHDPASPRHPAQASPEAQAGLGRVYEALDAALGRLAAAAGEGVEITVVSDHGSGGASDQVLYLNRALADAGLLRFREAPARRRAAQAVKDAALTRLPPALREQVFRLGGAVLPSWLESQARFGAIDFRKTVAFSDELNYFPGVWLNLRCRDAQGTVDDPRAATRAVRDALLALVNPFTGAPAVARVWRREELFDGPHAERAPDLLLRLNRSGPAPGYSLNLMPSAGAPPGTGPWRRLAPEEHLGRKGRSLPGSHRERGLFVAAGPRVRPVGEVPAHIADATATVLARMDVAVPPEAMGRVLWEALDDGRARARTLPKAPAPEPTPSPSRAGEAAIERRLRALGYVD